MPAFDPRKHQPRLAGDFSAVERALRLISGIIHAFWDRFFRPNRNRQAYGLTMLAPILPPERDDDGTITVDHTAEVKQLLAQLPRNGQSPLRDIPQLHTARFAVWDRLFFNAAMHNQRIDPAHPMPPAELEPASIASEYLLFTAAFDGTLRPFVEALAAAPNGLAAEVWKHCVAFPGTGDVKQFERWVRRCQVKTTWLYAAQPRKTVDEVLEAVTERRALVQFVAGSAGRDPAQLRADFTAFETLLDNLQPIARGQQPKDIP